MVFGRLSGDELLVKYLRGDKGEAMDDYMHYWGDNDRRFGQMRAGRGTPESGAASPAE